MSNVFLFYIFASELFPIFAVIIFHSTVDTLARQHFKDTDPMQCSCNFTTRNIGYANIGLNTFLIEVYLPLYKILVLGLNENGSDYEEQRSMKTDAFRS